jgi:aryl-alcohol dehydrogenase-like predicted oxidoreductase
MDDRFLGRTGLRVSELCFGTMMFGERADEQTSHRLLDRFVDAGGTFIDTADVYGCGRSEEILGSWLKGRARDDLVIATKVYGEAYPGGPVQGTGRKHVLAAVEASLRRLGTDYIDLYLAHVFDDATPQEETLSTLDTLVTSGKVRFVGASNYTGWQLQKAVDLARQHGWEPYVVLQPQYNLLRREAEWELIPVCRNEGLGVVPWAPLAQGWLSGRYRRGMTGPPEGTRVAESGDWADHDTEPTWRVLDALHEVAAEIGRPPAQVALRWLLQRPGITAPTVGATTLDQLEDNLGATGWSLTDEQMGRLTSASDPTLPYPYDILSLPQFRRRTG